MSTADRQKWDERYRGGTAIRRSPEPFLDGLHAVLPHGGQALDVAGGTGRNAHWLARRGLNVTLVDISTVALEQAARLAQEEGLRLRTLATDLDESPLPTGPWDVIVACHFLWRPLLSTAAELLSPGGYLVYIQPTRRNLERHASPSSQYLLDDGELPGLLSGLAILEFSEAWRESGRHEAWLLARTAR